jgi:hypothetical protein
MGMAVIADLVPSRVHGARYPRQTFHIDPDLKEGRGYLMPME